MLTRESRELRTEGPAHQGVNTPAQGGVGGGIEPTPDNPSPEGHEMEFSAYGENPKNDLFENKKRSCAPDIQYGSGTLGVGNEQNIPSPSGVTHGSRGVLHSHRGMSFENSSEMIFTKDMGIFKSVEEKRILEICGNFGISDRGNFGWMNQNNFGGYLGQMGQNLFGGQLVKWTKMKLM